MPAEKPRPIQHQWCDIDGVPISFFCWIEQVAEPLEPGARFSRLHQRGEVLGRGPGVVYVRFVGERQLVGMPAQLLRLLPDEPGGAYHTATLHPSRPSPPMNNRPTPGSSVSRTDMD